MRELGRVIDFMGYRRLVLKSDQEPAVKDLKMAVKTEKGVDIMLEESPAYDSRSNREVERAIQTVQGQVRAIKDAVEARYGEKLKPEDHIMPWLV